jgi:tetratricopeptide (TPR) repeat protein
LGRAFVRVPGREVYWPRLAIWAAAVTDRANSGAISPRGNETRADARKEQWKDSRVNMYRYKIDKRLRGGFKKGMLKDTIRRLALALLCVLPAAIPVAMAGASGIAVTQPERAEAWRLLADGDAAAAAADFGRHGDREARVGLGTALLAVQPRTAAGLERARQILEAVVEERIQDDWSVMAAFLLARWHQVHAIEPDAAEGERRLIALLMERAGHPWADAAAPKLAISWLKSGLDEVEYARREERLAALLLQVRDPAALRDTRLVMADSALRRGGDHARALPHYRALAAEAEELRPSLRARVLFQVAESAAALGLDEEAVAGWRRFFTEFPNDSRSGEASRRLKEVLSR